MGLEAPSHRVGKRTAPVGPLAAFVLCSVFVLVVLFRNLTPLQATLGWGSQTEVPSLYAFHLYFFCFCSLTAEPQPVWVLGGNVIPEEASPPGKWDLYGVNECSLGPPTLPPFSAVMNLRRALEFPPKNQILFPTQTRDYVGASFKEAHKSTTWWIEALDRVGIPQLNNFPALSSPFLLHRLHYISSLIPSQIPTNGRSFKPFRWNKVKSKQNKTIYFQFLPYCFFPRKLLN